MSLATHARRRTTPRLAAAGAIIVAACSAAERAPRSVVTDDFGDTLRAGPVPARIVSLNPTTTELLFTIGAGRRLVGRTTWDHQPAEAQRVPDLGAGLRPNVEAVLATRPDLVVLYASEDNRDAARRLRAAGVRTASYRVDRIADFARVTEALGRLTGDTLAARVTIDTTGRSLARVLARTAGLPHPSAFWIAWESPLLAIGGGSWLNELLTIAGARNVYDSLAAPSPPVTFEDLVRRDPDVVLASPAARARILADPRWRSLRAVREGRVLIFDTTIVNGPSARVASSALALARILHPASVR